MPPKSWTLGLGDFRTQGLIETTPSEGRGGLNLKNYSDGIDSRSEDLYDLFSDANRRRRTEGETE